VVEDLARCELCPKMLSVAQAQFDSEQLCSKAQLAETTHLDLVRMAALLYLMIVMC